MGRRYPSLVFLCCVIVGIIAADGLRWPTIFYLLISIVACLAAIGFAARQKAAVAVALFGICLLGVSAVRFGQRSYEFGPNHLSQVVENGGKYRIFGRVDDWPEFRANYTNFTISVDSLHGQTSRAVRGRLLLRVSDTTTALQRGDKVEFVSRIYSVESRPGVGQFDYSRFLNLKGVTAVVYATSLLDVRVDRANRYSVFAIVDKLRSSILSSLNRNLTPTAAALAGGFLIGETRNIPTDTYEHFRDSGTLHLLAVSGSNVALVILFLLLVLRLFALSRRSRSMILLMGVGLFALLSYGEPSVVRASVMAALVLLVQLIERRYDLNNIVALTALCILLYDPSQLFDVSFQLSFAAAWGLVFIVPRIHHRLPLYHGRIWYRYLVLPIIVATVAQICSAPLIAFYFQRTPLISPMANLVIVPLVSIAVVGVLVMLAADLILPTLGLWAGSLLTRLLELISKLLSWFGDEGTPIIQNAGIPPGLIIVAYVAVIAAAVSLTSLRARRALLKASLVAVNLVLGVTCLRTCDHSSSVVATSFNIPGGVATIIQMAEASEADLFITGLEGREYDVGEKILWPDLRQLGIKQLRLLVVVDADHNAVDDLRRLAVTTKTDRILVHPSFHKCFMDWESIQPLEAPQAEIVGTIPIDSQANVIFAAGHAVVARFCDEVVVLQRRFEARCPAEVDGMTTVIVAEPVLGMATYARLDNRATIICSKVIQPETDYEFPSRSMLGIGTEAVIDLARVGSYRMELNDRR